MQIINESTQEYKEKILSVNITPRKTNSSYGNWVVDYIIWMPFGDNKLDCHRFFMKKVDAIQWANQTQANLKQGE
jgi:hypothetical protein